MFFKILDFFEFKRDENKLIKTYQMLSQYLMFSINHLKKKNQILTDLSGQQLRYNEAAEEIIRKQVSYSIIWILLENENKRTRKSLT
jgi:hypothetical protein